MHHIKINILEAFRAYREDENEMSLDDLTSLIKGTYQPPPVMKIEDLIHCYLADGKTTQNEAFKLSADEIEQLAFIKNNMFSEQWYKNNPLSGRWYRDVPVYLKIDNNIAITGKIPLIYGKIGADIRVGNEFINTVPDREVAAINLYDRNLIWRFFCEAFDLPVFKLWVINYGDYRPYQFELGRYSFYYRRDVMLPEIKDEAKIFVEYCRANGLEKFIS